MITKELIDQINHLYHKAKTQGLTEDEQQEQSRLRQEYLKGIRARVRQTLDNVKVVDEEDHHGCGCGGEHGHTH